MNAGSSDAQDSFHICRRCGKALLPGQDNFYVVHIEAVADPAPIVTTAADTDASETMSDLHDELSQYSEQELADMVCRRLEFCLCGRCFTPWIEEPVT